MSVAPQFQGVGRLVRSLLVVAAATGLVFIFAESAAAQTYRDSSPTSRSDNSSRTDYKDRSRAPATNLPSWAEPSSSSSDASSSSAGQFSPDEVSPKAPPPGGGGDQVPVDGGLAFLAAAGAGYAVRKLNDGDSEDEE